MRTAVGALLVAMSLPDAASAVCPSQEQLVDAGVNHLFSGLDESWITYPLGPAPVTFNSFNLQAGPFIDPATHTFFLGPHHMALAGLGYINLEIEPYVGQPTGSEFPTFHIRTDVPAATFNALGQDVRTQTEANLSVVQFFVELSPSWTEIESYQVSEDGASARASAFVVFEPNLIGERYLRSLGLSPTIGQTMIVTARCSDQTDFLGNPLIALDQIALRPPHGRSIRINLDD